MGILPDWMIQRDVKIEPFAESAVRPGVISYGVSSYGYDVRVGRNFKVFTNVHCAIVDPKHFNPASFVDFEADYCLIPPNSFALAETVEYFEIPRDVLCICLGKCVTGDTRVVDADTGEYLPIKEFIDRKRGRTLGLDGLKIAAGDVSGHYHSGIDKVYELTTFTGLKIRTTAAHPFRTFEGWQPLSDLQPGDRVAVARHCPTFGKDDLPEQEATLLGSTLADSQARDEQVPQAIFRARRESVAAFLRALFSGKNSSCRTRSRKGVPRVTLEFASASRRLVEDVRHLLLRFGIYSRLRSRISECGRRTHRVQIADAKMLRLFRREIGLLPSSENQHTLDARLAEVDTTQRRSKLDALPKRAGRLPDVSGRTTVSALATADPQFSELTAADVVWDRVVSIEPMGMQAVYDLTVPGLDSFHANDLLVHNSTYARCGVIVNVTPLEPEWRGKVTIEISNTTPLPAKIYAGEGIAQILFLKAEEVCKISYGDRKGKYQDQKGLTLPFVIGQQASGNGQG